jgi:ATP-dependent DNA helicase Q1
MSEGRIKTGVYHAEIKASDKEKLHERWRLGEVKVMCATIGVSINCSDWELCVRN